MRFKNSFSRVMTATAGVAIAATVWGAGPAFAASSTTINPAGAHTKIANIGSVSFGLGGWTVTCSTLAANGQVPASPGNHNASGPVSINSTSTSVSGCSINAPFTSISSVTTSGTWTISAQNGSPITGSLVIPKGGVVMKTTGLATCTVTAAPSGPATVNGTFVNGTNSTSNPSTLSPNSGSTVAVSVTGGGFCPSATSATLTAKLGAYDTDNTATAITVSS